MVAYLHGGGTDQPLALARLRPFGAKVVLVHRDWQASVDFATLPTGGVLDCERAGAVSDCEHIMWPGLDVSVGFQRAVSDVGAFNWWGTAISGDQNATGIIDMLGSSIRSSACFCRKIPWGSAGASIPTASAAGMPSICGTRAGRRPAWRRASSRTARGLHDGTLWIGELGRLRGECGARPAINKAVNELPVVADASAYTNALSYFGLKQFRGLKIGTQILGTNRVFGLLGRANLALGAGLAAYDATSIGMCVARQ